MVVHDSVFCFIICMSLVLKSFMKNYRIYWVLIVCLRHCTRFRDKMSPIATISVQGSGIGQAAYVVTASDMWPRNNGNASSVIKYAVDTYLVIPAANNHTNVNELSRIEGWAADNNLRLNTAKSKELTYRGARGKSEPLPPPCLGIKRVTELTLLDVIISDQLTVSDHVIELLASCSRLLYALRVLRARGLLQQTYSVEQLKPSYTPRLHGSAFALQEIELDWMLSSADPWSWDIETTTHLTLALCSLTLIISSSIK